MEQLRHDLDAVGLEAAALTAEITLQHIPAGQREHWSGGQVTVFRPVAESLRLVDGGQLVVQASFRVADGAPAADVSAAGAEDPLGRDAADAHEAAHWASVQAPAGWDGPTLAQLAREVISRHRALTSELHTTYEQIESDPREIERIVGRRETLRVGLEPLLRVIEFDNAALHAIIDDDEAKFADALYERDRHLSVFRDRPCERILYDALRATAREKQWLGTMEFAQFYEWYLRSNETFGGEQALTGEVGDQVRATFTTWASADEQADPDRLKSHLKWIWRNYKVHPHHREAVGQALTEVYETLHPQRPKGHGPRP